MDSSESQCAEGELGDSVESESHDNDSLYIPAKTRFTLWICPIKWVLLLCPNWEKF